MKAAILKELHGYPEIEIGPIIEPKQGQSLIRVEATALNRRDEWIRVGAYPHIRLPAVLGSDVCGLVESSPANPSLIGERVLLCPSLDWGGNEAQQSPKFHILGMPSSGGLSEFVCMDNDLIFKAPKHLSAPQAAAFPLAGLTAWRAVATKGQLKSGQRCLVTGAGGGVSSFAIRFALALGAEVWVTSGSDDVIASVKRLGVRDGVNYRDPDWSKKIKTGFDLIVDGAGGEGFGALIRCLGMSGKIVFYGGTCGKWPKISPQHLFFRQASIVGTTMGSPKEFEEMLSFIERHQLTPRIDSEWALGDIEAAFCRLVSPERDGKVVIRMSH